MSILTCFVVIFAEVELKKLYDVLVILRFLSENPSLCDFRLNNRLKTNSQPRNRLNIL